MTQSPNAAGLPRRGNVFSRALGRSFLRLVGWRIAGQLPELPRLVVIVAPHTSNWDFFIGVGVQLALGLDICWLGKHTLFLGPWALLLRWLGGIPVNRAAPQGLLPELVRRLNSRDRFLLALAPEGTRSKVERWKSGFHAIARQTGVPIAPVALDYGPREVRFGVPRAATADFAADLAELQKFYEGVTPRHPEKF
ncbi:MAG: lysophospholipid acyltransferase family protein [Desulfuromonadales bacterium]|nr:lysophospholipid acyltransferase family protein [Desulfuromonadales bacterium]